MLRTTVRAVSNPAQPDVREGRDPWTRRVGPLFAAVWLVYLSYPWSAAWSAAAGTSRTLSLLSVVGFAAVFLIGVYRMRRWRLGGAGGRRQPEIWAVLGPRLSSSQE